MAKNKSASCMCSSIRSALTKAGVTKPSDPPDKLVAGVESIIASHKIIQAELIATQERCEHLKTALKEAVKSL